MISGGSVTELCASRLLPRQPALEEKTQAKPRAMEENSALKNVCFLQQSAPKTAGTHLGREAKKNSNPYWPFISFCA